MTGPLHSEGLVVEFTCASGRKWIGNFEPGTYGVSGVFAIPGRTDQGLVIAEGQAYVVAPDTCSLVRTFGGEMTHVFDLPDRGTMIFGNGLWFECDGPQGLRWKTDRISWDGMAGVSLDGDRLRGNAFTPGGTAHPGGTWSPFEVDIDTGEVTGGSYPRELGPI